MASNSQKRKIVENNSDASATQTKMSKNSDNTKENESCSTSSSDDDICCAKTTEVKITKCTAKWTIKNFSYLPLENGESLDSPFYYGGTENKIKYWLRMYPCGRTTSENGCISLFLYVECKDTQKVKVKYTFSIIDKSGVQKNSMEAFSICNIGKGLGFSKFIDSEELLEKKDLLVINDSITIFCSLFIGEKIVHYTNQRMEHIQKKNISNFASLYTDNKFRDVQFIIGDNKITAHKTVLAASSQVFYTMFDTWKGNENGLTTFHLNEIDFETFAQLLKYIYLSKIDNINLAEGLLRAANKFLIPGLKRVCEEALCKLITIQTACHFFVLSHLCEALNLKLQAEEFIKINKEAIMRTSDFKMYMKTQPHLIVPIFQSQISVVRKVQHVVIE